MFGRQVMHNIAMLDKLQLQAVNCRNRNILVVAAPGSGKTTVIINRVAYLIKQRKVNYENIVVITFTRSAAQNMENRYLKLSNSRGLPYFGTLHSLFYRILKKYNPHINIIPEKESYKLVKAVLLKYLDEISEETVREVVNSISFFKTSGMDMQDYVPGFDKFAFKECYEKYETYKKDNGYMDFDDLQLACFNLLKNNQEVLDHYRNKFKHMLIDEFQDCDQLQIEILKLLSRGNSIFAVGDEDQAIYGFRGSKPEYMVNFSDVFHDGKKLYLSTNYRSTKNIVEMSKKLICHNIKRNKKQICANRNSLSDINLILSRDESNQAEKIGETINELVSLGKYSYKEFAVLYRTNRECRYLLNCFTRMKIPFDIMDEVYNFYDHFICKDLISYMKLSLNSTDKNSILRIINRPFRYIGKLNLLCIVNSRYKEDRFDDLISNGQMNLTQIKDIIKMKRRVGKIKHLKPSIAVDYILNKISYLSFLKEYCNKNKLNLKDMLDIVNTFKEDSEKFTNIQEFLLHINNFQQQLAEKSEVKNGVILSTIHGVKGMEFKNVFIINCIEENIPYTKRGDANIEEERRLFYVAITRTMENLWFCFPEILNGIRKEKSSFLEECGVELHDAESVN